MADPTLARLVKTRRGRRDVRRQCHIVHAQHRIVVRWRFLFQNVQRGVGDPAFLQRLDQRLFIHGRVRPVMMKMALGFICLKSFSPSMWWTSGRAGECIETKSDCASTSDRVAGITPQSEISVSWMNGS